LPVRRRPLQDLRSPTLSPSRREIQPWNVQSTAYCCTTSYAESIATTATMQSEDEDMLDEIRSTATTQVVSHRQAAQNSALFSSTLASAEKQFRRQEDNRRRRQDEEDKAYQYLTRPHHLSKPENER
jgi:Skp family chaperone for outer membrane proteins